MKSFPIVEMFFCCALADDQEWHGRDLRRLWLAAGDERCWNFCVQNRAESVVALALRQVVSAEELPVRWTEAAATVAGRVGLYMEEMDRIGERLHEKGIAIVALKNCGIARGILREPAACPMGDVDVLVAPQDFRAAHAVMVASGYYPASRSSIDSEDSEEAEKAGGGEYTIVLKDGSTLWFELQWRPVAGRWIRPDQEPAAEALLRRSLPSEGTHVRLLDPNDNLLQVCLHTAKHTFVRAPGFRLHTDVDRIVRRTSVDWDKFVEEVERSDVCTAVCLSLEIPRLLLQTPVPDWVIRRIRRPKWKISLMLRWIHRAGLFNPDEKKFSKIGYIVFNLMLYDSWRGVIRGMFPETDWMCKRYGIQRKWQVPIYWGYRGVELLFKRAKT